MSDFNAGDRVRVVTAVFPGLTEGVEGVVRDVVLTPDGLTQFGVYVEVEGDTPRQRGGIFEDGWPLLVNEVEAVNVDA